MSAVEVILDLIVSHLFPVAITAQNLAELVIVITVENCFTCVFNIVKAFVDCCPNLALQRVIVIWLKWINGVWFDFGEGQ